MDRTSKVKTHIIEPYTKLYACTLNAEQIEAFVEDLGGYSVAVLQAAWKQVRQTVKSRPTVAHIAEACRQNAGAREGSAPAKFSDSLAQQDRDDQKAATDHASRVLNSTLGLQARAEGWDLALRRFIVDAALAVSAMRRKRAVPFNEVTLLNCLHVNAFNKGGAEPELKRRRDEMLSHLQYVASAGAAITVPNHLIDEWRMSPIHAAA